MFFSGRGTGEVQFWYLVHDFRLVSKRIILEGTIEYLWCLNKSAVDLVVESQQEAHCMENDLWVVCKHVAVHVQHDWRIGQHSGNPCLHTD